MSLKIRLGIVGLGAMGSEMLSVAAVHPDFEVTACADVNETVIEAARRQHPNVGFTAKVSEIINAADVDAVYVACPPKFHAAYVIEAMLAGKAVFCEKPLAISIAEGEEMVRVARETNSVTAMNFALADRNAVLEMQRAVREGEIGEIVGVETRLLFPRWVRDFQAGAKWLEQREQGGFVREVFSHFAFLTDRLLGDAKPEFTRLGFESGNRGKSETFAFGLFRFGSVPITLTARSRIAVPESYEYFLYGSKRSYYLKDWGELFAADENGWQKVELSTVRGTEHTRLSAFARQIRGGEEARLPDLETGLRVQRIVEAFHENPSGRPCELVGQVSA